MRVRVPPSPLVGKLGLTLLSPLRWFFETIFAPVYKKRIARELAKVLPNAARVLDFGCNDGSLAEMILKMNPTLKIEGVDIQDKWKTRIKKNIYDGRILPYKSGSFDAVISVDVLHHISDIDALLKEICRVSRKLVIIKDHTVYGKPSRLLVSTTDYVSNVGFGIKCAFNYPTPSQWRKSFERAGLKIVHQPQNIKYGFGLGERYNPIFVLEKIRV